MRDQIFKPLGMKDAGFYVPEEKRKRFATLYENDGHGGLKLDTSNGNGMGDFLTPPTMPSGGGGLVSTAEDYYRFALMLANGGERRTHSGPGYDQADGFKPCAPHSANRRVWRWSPGSASGVRLRL
jgi:CubicO group peptidase (beta-lactamase class C family)